MEKAQKMIQAAEQRRSRSDIYALMHLSDVTRGVTADMASYFEKPKFRMASFVAESDMQ